MKVNAKVILKIDVAACLTAIATIIYLLRM